jgi:hypothetical protein
MQVNKGRGHSMIPSVPDGLLAKPFMEPIEGPCEPLTPFTCPLGSEWRLIEHRDLFDEGRETCQAHRHQTKPDPPMEAPLEQGRENRREINLPARFRWDTFTFRDYDLVAVADREGYVAAHTSLAAERATEPLQDIQEPSPQHIVIYFIRLKRNGLFKTRLNGRG